MHKLLLTWIVVLLAGCATTRPIATSVTSHHDFPSEVHGITFMVLPFDESTRTSPGFDDFAAQIRAHLEALGMVGVGRGGAAPDFIVLVAYGVDSGHDISFPYPIIGYTGGRIPEAYGWGFRVPDGMPRTSGTVTTRSAFYRTPTFVVAGTGSKTKRVYRRFLILAVIDRAGSVPEELKVVYKGQAVSEGSRQDAEAVVPVLIRAVFRNFPGTDGETRKEIVAPGSVD